MDGKKVICFHGFGTSGEFMKFQMSSWVEKYPKTKFIHVDGVVPFPAKFTMDPDIIQFHGSDKPVYSNFSSSNIDELYKHNLEDNSDHTKNDYDIIKNRDEIKRVVDIIRKEGGIDGMIGFSQGCLLAQLMAFYLENTYDLSLILEPEKRPYFTILFCPVPGITYPSMHKIPTLILRGTQDLVVETGFLMMLRFSDVEYAEFEGGHKVPIANSRIQRLVMNFVQKAMLKREKYLKTTSLYLKQSL